MSAAEDLAANRRAQRDLVRQHQALGEKFNTFAAPHRRACDEKLRREGFPPFVAIERAREKVGKAQSELASKLRDLEVAQRALLEQLDAEHADKANVDQKVEVEVDLEDLSKPGRTQAEDIPEIDL